MTKQELLDKLQSSEELIRIAYVPVSEVITWVNELEDKSTLSEQQIKDITDSITEELCNVGTDLLDDYELEMNYREVEVTSIDVNEGVVRRAVTQALSDYEIED
jgi:hypothetical protein